MPLNKDTDSDSNKREPRNSVNTSVINTAKKSTGQFQVPSAPQRPPLTRQSAEFLKKQTTKFMENFNPETSTREKRKLNRKILTSSKTAYDERGILHLSQVDLCDCLVRECVGCHFACPKCTSPKCGSDCRVNRKFVYEQIEFCGCDYVVKNPL